MPLRGKSTVYHTPPIVLVIVVAILVLVGILLGVKYLPVSEQPAADSTLVPVRSTTTLPGSGQRAPVTQSTTEIVSAAQLSQPIDNSQDLDTALRSLDSVDVDYIDSLLQQNDQEATQF